MEEPSGVMKLIEQAPLPWVGSVLLLALVLAAAVGYSLRRWHDNASGGRNGGAPSDSQETYLVSAVLGLLALLTGFTFSLAIDRFETRRENVLLEANAIGTTYLRAQLLQEPHRSRVSRMLVDYTDNRIALGTARGQEAARLLQINDHMLTDLWAETVAAFPGIKAYDFSTSFLEAMNQLIDMDATRKAGRYARVPTEVLIVLMIYMLISASVLGYVLSYRRGRMAAGFLLALFTLSILLIIDINRPITGGVTESQAPMIALRESLRTQPPSLFDHSDSR